MKLRKLDNEKGAALIFVLIVFLVLVILTTSVAFVFSNNHRQSVYQEEKMRAHYLNMAGVDVTLSTLLSPLYVEDGEEKSMADRIREHGPANLSDNIEIDGEDIAITVSYNSADDNITIVANVTLDHPSFTSGISDDLTLKIDFSGRQHRLRWE